MQQCPMPDVLKKGADMHDLLMVAKHNADKLKMCGVRHATLIKFNENQATSK